MPYDFPDYSTLDIGSYEYYQGSFALGFIKKHCKDIAIIGAEDWKDFKNYDWLEPLLSQYLADGKKVLLVPNEEGFIYPPRESARQLLNSYQDKNVWLVTQLGVESQAIYTHQHQFTVKLIELPHVLMQLCEDYYKNYNKVESEQTDSYNFLCMTGRFEQHKGDLIELLHEYGLNDCGLITVAPNSTYPEHIRQKCTINDLPLVGAEGAYLIERLTKLNVQNFLNIERKYKNIPLILQAETSCGTFYTTEKSLWPLLMGKLYLGFGPPYNTKHIQKFYDFSFSRYLDLTFDQYPEDWSAEGQKNRMKLMIEKNYNLIQDCKTVYNTFRDELEAARWTIGKNFYNFFTSQLQTLG